MATLLMLVIFCGFVGLGIPDSMFGASWPAIYSDFSIPISYANFVTIILSVGTIVSSVMSGRINAKFSAVSVSIVSTLLTALGLLGFYCSKNLWFLCLCSIPLGFGAGAIDSALNHFVALHYSASAMNFLHCSYGVGVTVGPLVMAGAISSIGWRGGYLATFFIQLVITLILLLSIPLWKRVGGNAEKSETPAELMTLSETVKLPGFWFVLLMFFTSCGIEFTCGNWGSTFLVEAKHLSASAAARMVTLYYVGITAGRFLSGILATRMTAQRIVQIGLACVLCAIGLLFIANLPLLSGFALFLVGFGNGPIFPNLMHLTPKFFGHRASASAMGLQMASANTGILLVPMLFGFLTKTFGLELLPFYLLLFFLPLAISFFKTNKRNVE